MVPRPAGGYSSALDGAQPLSHFSGSSAPFRNFELEHAIRLLLDVLDGLGILHNLVIEGRPFVHGGVSPEHICVDAHGKARLMALAHPHSTVEAARDLNGYAAPEWLLGNEVDPRADLFSVGVLLWEALAGRRLFPDPSSAVVLAQLASGTVPRPCLAPGAGWAKSLCSVAERALAPAPADRPASAQGLSRAILMACGPRLMRPLGDRWHDEAPTLPGRPRPQPAPERTHTPPGFVIDLTTAAKSEEWAAAVERAGGTPVPVSTFAPLPPAASPACATSSLRGLSSRASLRPWLLGAAAATYLALIGWVQASRHAPRVEVKASNPPAAATLAPTTLVAPALASAPLAASAASPVSPMSAPPAANVAPPAVSTSIAPATSLALPRPHRSAPARRRTPKPHVADYGI
jgi:hypothetical protein